MSDETTPGRPYTGSLRQQIASRLGAAWPDLAEDPVHLDQLAAQAMAVVQPYADRLKAEIRQLRILFDETERSLPIEQRRLLAISRMVFDGIAQGHPFTRDEAADLAQRIVDEIGHSVTDEPALGPSSRVEIAELKAEIGRLRKQFPDCNGICMTGADVGVPEAAGIAYPHPDCPLHGDPDAEAYRRADQAGAERDRLRAAWWSARIGRARARESHRRARAVAQIRGSEVTDLKRRRTELIIEADHLKATVARVKALADDLEGARAHVFGKELLTDLLRRALELPAPVESDLPAVRDFAAGLDPRREPPCPT